MLSFGSKCTQQPGEALLSIVAVLSVVGQNASGQGDGYLSFQKGMLQGDACSHNV